MDESWSAVTVVPSDCEKPGAESAMEMRAGDRYKSIEIRYRLMDKGTDHDWNGWSYDVLDRPEQTKRGGEAATVCEVRAEFQPVRSSSYGAVKSRSCIMSRRKTVRPGVV